MIKTLIKPALAGEVGARERLRLLLSGQEYKIVGDGDGRLMVHIRGEIVPVPPYPGMEVDNDPASAAQAA